MATVTITITLQEREFLLEALGFAKRKHQDGCYGRRGSPQYKDAQEHLKNMRAMLEHAGENDDGESSSSNTQYTPSQTTTDYNDDVPTIIGSDRHDPRPVFPQADNIYLIIEHSSNAALTTTDNDQVKLATFEGESAFNAKQHWLCIEEHGFVGFQNVSTGKYLGHDAKESIFARVPHFAEWEFLMPRVYPHGWFKLLSLRGGSIFGAGVRFAALDVEHRDGSIVRRDHSSTLWRFVKVERPGADAKSV